MNNLLIKSLRKLNLLSSLNLIGELNLNNKRFKIPILGKVGYSNLFMSEPWMVDLLKKIIPSSEATFIDVGVNTGQTLIKLRSVSENINYIGFEPNPNCVNYVESLIKQNQFQKSTIIPAGISNKTDIGILNFYYDTKTDSSASIIEDFRPNEKVARRSYIPLFSLTDLASKISLENVSILKIDVEGAELEVLKSFDQILANQKPIILIEILPVYNSNNEYRLERQHKIEALIKTNGYLMYRVIKQNEELKGFELIDSIGIHSDLNLCEYVFFPKGREKEVRLIQKTNFK